MTALIAAIAAVAMVPQGGQGGNLGQGNRGVTDMGTEETFDHILTPGDKTNWDLKCKAGEVVILKVTSDTFDPGVEFCDKNDKKIMENDDEEDGVQSSLLLVYIEKEGDYRVHVKNYRNAGGGRYQLSVRRFVTKTVEAGKTLALEENADQRYYIRILAPKGKLVSMHGGAGFSSLIGENGKPQGWHPIFNGQLVNAFRAEQSAYYARVHASPTKDDPTSISAVVATERPIEVGKPQQTTPADKGIDVWKLKVKDGDFLTFKARGSRALPCYFPAAIGNIAEGGVGFKIIKSTRKWEDTIMVMFTKTGDVDLCVPPSDAKAGYTFSVVEAWRPWDGLSTLADQLQIGTTMYYGFDAKPAHMARLAASAKTFDLVYRLYDRHLNQVQAIDDQAEGDMNIATTVSLPAGGRYYLAITCFGSGGGGPYQVDSTPIMANLLKLNETVQAELNGPLDGLWTMKVDKPQTLTIRLKTQGSAPMHVIDPKGQEVAQRSMVLQAYDYLIAFEATMPGEYRIWREWKGVNETYSMRVGPIAD